MSRQVPLISGPGHWFVLPVAQYLPLGHTRPLGPPHLLPNRSSSVADNSELAAPFDPASAPQALPAAIEASAIHFQAFMVRSSADRRCNCVAELDESDGS